jgi:hypothetical protein
LKALHPYLAKQHGPWAVTIVIKAKKAIDIMFLDQIIEE